MAWYFFALWVLFAKIFREKKYHGQKNHIAVLSELSFRITEVRSQITKLGSEPYVKRDLIKKVKCKKERQKRKNGRRSVKTKKSLKNHIKKKLIRKTKYYSHEVRK